MNEQVIAASVLERLLLVSLASRDAFSYAAHAVRSPGFALLFAQRAEAQRRMVTYLRGQLALMPTVPAAPEVPGRAGMASPVPDVIGPPGERAIPIAVVDDPRALLSECLRVHDAATLEFCRWYGPSVALVLSNSMRHDGVGVQHHKSWR